MTWQSEKISSYPHADDAGQGHQAGAELAEEGLEEVGVLRGAALVEDDLADAAVVEHAADVGVARDDGLRAELDLGVDPDRQAWRWMI